MAEKNTDKVKTVSQAKNLPKDAKVIIAILKECGITEYEPRVINQLLEFKCKYVAGILEDAKTYSNHAKKKAIDLEDVRLAMKIQLEHSFTVPPPREVLSEVARVKNSGILPVIKAHCGVRLPQDKYCLSTANMVVKSSHAKGQKSGGQFSQPLSSAMMKPSMSMKRPVPKYARQQTLGIAKVKPPTVSRPPSVAEIMDSPKSDELKRKREDDIFDVDL